MAVNVQQMYQQNSVNTATPQELTLMLFNAGIKFLKLAKQEIEQKQLEEANKHIIRVQDIISELELGLNPNIEIAKQMAALYDFMKYHLIQANINKDLIKIDEVVELFEEFRNTWKQAIELAKR